MFCISYDEAEPDPVKTTEDYLKPFATDFEKFTLARERSALMAQRNSILGDGPSAIQRCQTFLNSDGNATTVQHSSFVVASQKAVGMSCGKSSDELTFYF